MSVKKSVEIAPHQPSLTRIAASPGSSLILKVKFSHVLINVSLTGALVGVRADLLLSGPLPLFLLPQLQYSRVLELKFVYDDILSSLGKMCIEVGPDSKMAEIRSERLASRRLAFFF